VQTECGNGTCNDDVDTYEIEVKGWYGCMPSSLIDGWQQWCHHGCGIGKARRDYAGPAGLAQGFRTRTDNIA